MFVETMKRAAMAASKLELPKISAQVWKAFAVGLVSESEAQELAELLEARKTIPIDRPAPRRVGSRPISSASIERRRRWVAAGMLPPTLACRFTPAETAVLAVIAAEASKRGVCKLPIGAIAALAGVSKTTVHNALREARAVGLLNVQERRLSRWRNLSNIVRIVSPEWTTWLAIGIQRGGCKFAQGTHKDSLSGYAPFEGSHRARNGVSERHARPSGAVKNKQWEECDFAAQRLPERAVRP